MSNKNMSREQLMELEPRWETEEADPPFVEEEAIWLGQLNEWDLWAIENAVVENGIDVDVQYSLQAVSEYADMMEIPFDVPESIAFWRRTLASSRDRDEREQADVMLECCVRLHMKRDDVAQKVGMEQFLAPETIEKLMDHLKIVKRIYETAGLN